jgi:ribosomal protein S17E
MGRTGGNNQFKLHSFTENDSITVIHLSRKKAMLQLKKCIFIFVSLCLISMLGCTSTTTTNSAPEVSPEGMSLKVSTGSTIAYEKPGVDFSGYDKLIIMPSEVAFKKNWERDYNREQSGLSTRIRDKDVIRIKEDVATLFDQVFKQEFSQASSITLVEEVSANTLIMRPAIINLDVNAPDIQSASNVKRYTEEAGEATLFVELYDGVSGEILVRILSAAVAGDNSYYHWANRVSNRADATRMIKMWADALIDKYQQVHTTTAPM